MPKIRRCIWVDNFTKILWQTKINMLTRLQPIENSYFNGLEMLQICNRLKTGGFFRPFSTKGKHFPQLALDIVFL